MIGAIRPPGGDPREVDEEEGEPDQEGRTRPLRSERGGRPGCEPQRQLRARDCDRRQHGRVDAEKDDEVEGEEGERPARARPCVEVDGERGEHAERHTSGAEREAAPPVQAQSLPRVRQHEVARSHDGHRAMGQGRSQRACEHGEHEQCVNRDRQDSGEDEHRPERRVDGNEPPRIPVQVGEREPESTPRAHPFTPAETTPDTKNRWKARKMTRMGRMAMTAPAEISGHSVP